MANALLRAGRRIQTHRQQVPKGIRTNTHRTNTHRTYTPGQLPPLPNTHRTITHQFFLFCLRVRVRVRVRVKVRVRVRVRVRIRVRVRVFPHISSCGGYMSRGYLSGGYLARGVIVRWVFVLESFRRPAILQLNIEGSLQAR